MPIGTPLRLTATVVAMLFGLLAGAAAPPSELDRFDAHRKQHAQLPNGITLAYVEFGDPKGAPLVLVHGFTDTLRDWQPHEGAQTGDGDLTVVRGACGVNDHVGILVRAGCVPSGAVAQKVQCRIVGDTKQPALRVNDRSGIGQHFERLDDRFLHHVLSVDDRAGHARAVAMQLGPQFAEQPIARRARFN